MPTQTNDILPRFKQLTDGIHDPAQAWNTLTVGRITEQDTLTRLKFPGWQPLAATRRPCSVQLHVDDVGPKWPIKPDIVMEAGNMGRNPEFEAPDYIDDLLQLLSASRDFAAGKPLTSFGDTSAATALAARYAAMAWAKYPLLRPETIRALMVHSAQWNPAMLARYTDADGAVDMKGLVRSFGYGCQPAVPSFQPDNSLTLLVESELQPFFKDARTTMIGSRPAKCVSIRCLGRRMN